MGTDVQICAFIQDIFLAIEGNSLDFAFQNSRAGFIDPETSLQDSAFIAGFWQGQQDAGFLAMDFLFPGQMKIIFRLAVSQENP